ncbi:TPA: hypothetical protein DCR49_09385 [Candidatus Delongbacteria bacterium]|nr:MAG: hypothetical protein A2Y39_00565 [Candidatus Delongbacteria bacterium GWF2_40_14]HAQ62187.1 hypothetical protein [Candidatus Delongbacteria bacterium]
MENKDFTTHCGLYCKLCANYSRISQISHRLRDILLKEGYDYFGEYIYPEYKDFRKVLDQMADRDPNNSRCFGGCGNPECRIRECAKAKGLEYCAFCDNFPCENFTEGFLKTYPCLIANNKRIKEIGIDAWIIEQEENFVSKDYSYNDDKSL